MGIIADPSLGLFAPGAKIRNNKIFNSTGQPIYIAGTDQRRLPHVEITGNIIERTNTSGIAIANLVDSKVENNLYHNDVNTVVDSPIKIAECKRTIIKGNTIRGEGEGTCNALWVVRGEDIVIENNLVDLRGGDGSHSWDPEGELTIRNNTFYIRGAGYNSIWFPKGNRKTRVYGNKFYFGGVMDEGDRNIFCVHGIGNEYLTGATYHGPDPCAGTCCDD